MGILAKMIGFILNILRKIVAASPRLRGLLYDLQNRQEFGNLYEHEKMLADSVRVGTYKKGIEKLVKPGDVVLDLGTGSGILSFFAARSQAEKVYAIDHSNFIDVAEKIARHNRIDNIEFVRTHSRSFKPPIRFDAIIHEQMGDYLFNENMVENLLDLKNRLLKPEGKILPGRFELFLEPVHLKETFDVPYIWENRLYGIDFGFLKDYFETLDDFQPSDYHIEWLESESVRHFLSSPEPILTFDLNAMKSEEDLPRDIEVTRTLTRGGVLNGFCLYFRAIFDDEIAFTTSPLAPLEKNTHWGCCFFRVENRRYSGQETIKYKLSMPDFLDIKSWKVTKRKFQVKVVKDLEPEKSGT